jgi:glycosyltransferase involved in cell wall biosynthesis
MLKVLLVHNFYQQNGGEDTVFASEGELLREKGHEVIEYIEHNDRIRAMSKLDVAAQTLWSRYSYNRILDILKKEKPDIAHFHNTFPLISPSTYFACRSAGIPVIQSLDNPRLLCPSANFYRNGTLCQDCLGKTYPWPGVLHGCYHHSRLQTAVVATMLSTHRWINTWNSKVDYYLVATEFYKSKFIKGGLPADKIIVKPHFIYPDPQSRPEKHYGDYALFIGRLDPEKGIRPMLQAWKVLSDIPLKIRGDGQLGEEIRDFIKTNDFNNIKVVERLSKPELTYLIKNARFLVWPSEGYYETFGYVAVENFSCGVPVIASGIGVPREIVRDGITGMHFNPGDHSDLAAKVRWAWDHPVEMIKMGRNARQEYEEKYTADRNYQLLIGIYQKAIQNNLERSCG